MAIKSYYLDKRTLVSGESSYQKYDNALNLKEYIEQVVDDSETDFTSINVNTINESTVGNGVVVDNVKLKDGGVTNSAATFIASFYPQVAQNNITAGTGGAIIVTNYLTTINTDAGGDTFTLANGTQIGQMKKILLVVDGGGDGVVTPATAFAGGTTATFNDAGDFLILQWSGAAWVVIENSGVTIA